MLLWFCLHFASIFCEYTWNMELYRLPDSVDFSSLLNFRKSLDAADCCLFTCYTRPYCVFLLPRDATHSALMRLHVVCLSVHLWRWVMFFFTQFGNTSKIISRTNSLRAMRLLTPTWAIWCNGNTPKIRVEWGWGHVEHIKAAKSPKRCKIRSRLLWRTNRKSHTRFRLAPTWCQEIVFNTAQKCSSRLMISEVIRRENVLIKCIANLHDVSARVWHRNWKWWRWKKLMDRNVLF